MEAIGHEAETALTKKTYHYKSVLRLPDLRARQAAVLNSLTSLDAQRGYRHAIMCWLCHASGGEASWSRSNFFSGTFRCKRHATLGANSGFDRPSMISSDSRRLVLDDGLAAKPISAQQQEIVG